jgi:hypothetical protein
MPEETDHHDRQILVTYNGADNYFEYQPHELVGKLLEKAKKEFGVESQHMLSLFTEAGVELDDNKTLMEADVHPGQLLVLRQSTVKGGA